jgi:hypothetical protein
MTIETHFESAKQCQNLFGLNEAATTAAFGGQENLLFWVYFALFLKGNRNPNPQNFLACGAK